jgi:hydrogenase-4 membrane subunit HyfE
MLAANVAFLAIQGVIVVPTPPETGWIRASPAQIASSISLVFSIGSVTTGLLLIRRNRNIAVQGAAKAVRWFFPSFHFPS